MTRDEFAVALLEAKAVKVNLRTGDVFALRGGHGKPLSEPRKVGCPNDKGYVVASFRLKGERKQLRLHRLVWIKKHSIPEEGLRVCHSDNDKTNNRLCNLYLATNAQNTADAARDGLMPTGDRNGATKYSQEDKRAVWDAYQRGEGSTYALASRFGMSKSRVHQIVSGDRP